MVEKPLRAHFGEFHPNKHRHRPGGLLAPLGLVVASIRSLPDALEGPLSASRDMVIEIPVDGAKLRLIGSAIKIAGEVPEFRPPPALGEHNALVSG